MDVSTWQGKEEQALILRRLRWQARRGMLELDLLLEAFLRQYGVTFSKQEAEAFFEFLLTNDQHLFEVLLKEVAYEGEDPFDFVPRLRQISAVPTH